MFKKWFLISGFIIVIILGVLSFLLSHAFSQDDLLSRTTGDAADSTDISAVATYTEPIPAPKWNTLVTLKGVALPAEAFIKQTSNYTDCQVVFRDNFNFNASGLQKVPLTVTTLDYTVEVTAQAYILEPARVIAVEIGTASETIKPEDFILNYDILEEASTCDIQIATDLSTCDMDSVRRHRVDLTFNGAPFNAFISVVDTTPPTALPVSVTANTGQAVEPEAFVQDAYDVSDFAVRFENEEGPDLFAEGRQPVPIILEDIYGNTSTIIAALVVNPNVSPPVFKGLRDVEVLLGDTAMYKKNVIAEDSFGNPVSFTVDSRAVDTYTPGTYPVTYTATDVNGNVTVIEVNALVLEISEETIGEMVNKVLEKIITEDMTQRQMARKIFDWISANVGYTSDSPKDTAYQGAYRALQYRQGVCFTFYAISEVLLNRVGIDNMRITRIEGRTRHFWNLVYIDGAWYHYDATPTNIALDRFLFTDTQAEEYTEKMRRQTGSTNYYVYDKALYPEVVQ